MPGVPPFLPWFFKSRFALFLLIFLWETGPLTVAMVLKASRSSLEALLAFLFPPTWILGIFRLEVGPPTTAVVLTARRRFRLFRGRRAWGGASASARALASSAMSRAEPMVGMSLILSTLVNFSVTMLSGGVQPSQSEEGVKSKFMSRCTARLYSHGRMGDK